MSVASLTSPVISVSPDQDYLFKGYYASTCELVTVDKRWMDAEGVTLTGKWLDAEKKLLGSFTIPLPDTQDRWVEAYNEVRSPDQARGLQIVITRRSVGGRLRSTISRSDRAGSGTSSKKFHFDRCRTRISPDLRMASPSARHEEPGTNMDGDLQHSQ